MNVLHSQYSELTDTEVHTARVIGVTENIASKMISGQSLKVGNAIVHRLSWNPLQISFCLAGARTTDQKILLYNGFE